MPHPHLSKAPINEALLDIQFQLPAEAKVSDLLVVQEKIAAQYPEKKELRRWQSNLQFGPGKAPSASAEDLGVDGYQFWATDKKQVMQVRMNGFTYSRLRPYQDWRQFIDEGKRLWEICSPHIRPSKITRVAVRFINELPLSLPIKNFNDYLKFVPQAPDDQEYNLLSFLYRQVIQDPTTGISTIVTDAMEPTQGPTVKVLLDVDVFKVIAEDISMEAVWELVESFRDVKNKFFFGSLTTQTVEMFK